VRDVTRRFQMGVVQKVLVNVLVHVSVVNIELGSTAGSDVLVRPPAKWGAACLLGSHHKNKFML
jgi:hypothetical protein